MLYTFMDLEVIVACHKKLQLGCITLKPMLSLIGNEICVAYKLEKWLLKCHSGKHTIGPLKINKFVAKLDCNQPPLQ